MASLPRICGTGFLQTRRPIGQQIDNVKYWKSINLMLSRSTVRYQYSSLCNVLNTITTIHRPELDPRLAPQQDACIWNELFQILSGSATKTTFPIKQQFPLLHYFQQVTVITSAEAIFNKNVSNRKFPAAFKL